MGAKFWVKRFLVVFAGAWVIIAVAQLLRGHATRYSILQGLLWGAIAAAVFTVARIFQSRRGQHCAICRDTPEMRKPERGTGA